MANETEALFMDEAANSPEPMPSSTEQAAGSTEAPAKEVPAKEVSNEDVEVLPEGVKERTSEQFNKLKSQLKEERTRRMEYEEYLKTIPAPQYQQAEPEPLYDPNTGYVDISALEKLRLQAETANKRATTAEKRFDKYIREQQEREAYAAHPEIDPKSDAFDRMLFNTTRAILTDSIMNPRDYGGKELTAKEAADLAKKAGSSEVKKIETLASQKAIEQLTPKEQASLEATGSTGRRTGGNIQELKDRTRRGDADAIVQRLKGIPSI